MNPFIRSNINKNNNKRNKIFKFIVHAWRNTVQVSEHIQNKKWRVKESQPFIHDIYTEVCPSCISYSLVRSSRI